MRIKLIQASSLTVADTGRQWGERNKRYSYAPTTLTTLAALVPLDLGAEVEIVDEGVEVLDEGFEADLVGISATTPCAPRAYEIADAARARGITVVMGGYHASAVPNEALRHADSVVIGFAEQSWPQLLWDYQNNQLQRMYRSDPGPVFEGQMPEARRDMLKKRAYALRGTIEATRGCRNRCEYCVIPGYTRGRVLQRPVGQVIDEIKRLKSWWVTFLDSSPTEDLDYVKRLYRALAPLRRRWFTAATLKAAEDDEWIELAASAGCRGVLIGFETTNQNTLTACRKGFNKPDRYVELVRRLHDRKLRVLGCFVFGLDGDDRTVFEQTLDFVNQACVDICQYTVFTPLPGTPTYERIRAQGRLIETDWRLYDGKHVVYQPSHMTVEDLQLGIQWAWRRTYGFRSIWHRVIGSRAARALNFVSNLAFRKYGKTFIPSEFSAGAHDARFRTPLLARAGQGATG